MKKIAKGLKVLSILGIGLLSSCTVQNNTNEAINENNIGFGAYSTASLLSALDLNTTVSASNSIESGDVKISNLSTFSKLNAAPVTSELNTDQLSDYYNMLAPFLENGTDNIIQYGEIKTDDPDYEFVQEMVLSLGGDKTQTFTLKYNKGEEAVKEDEDEVDDEYESEEVKNRFEGILILGDKTYDFVGVSKSEKDEEKFEMKAYIDEQNYVKMEFKNEGEEAKYEYEISQNGEITTTSMKIANEEDEFKVQLIVNEQGMTSEFTLKKELEDGVEVMKMEYSTPESEGVIFVNKTTNDLGEEVIAFTVKPVGEDEYVVEEEVDSDFEEDEDDEKDEKDDEEEDAMSL